MTQTFKLYIAAGLLIAATLTGWQARSWYESAKDLASLKVMQEMLEIFEKKESKVSQQVELRLQELRANETVIEKHINTIIERPIYSTNCIDDDGLSLTNAIIDGTATEFTFEMSRELNTPFVGVDGGRLDGSATEVE